MVTDGVALAELVGLPEYLIGLLTGLGTTMLEIVVTGFAAYEGRSGISIRPILGSTITDPVFTLGIGGVDRRGAVVCLLLYLPTFVVL